MGINEVKKQIYRLPNKPRLFESFAGVGMQRMGFDRLGINYEMVGISEIDKYAIQSYMAIHGPTQNYGDITKIKGDDLPQIDVFTYSFPCQDLSVAGKGRGIKEGTRSGLVFEVLRILRELNEVNRLPGLLIMENVTALLNKKHIDGFEQIKSELVELGYTNYVDKLNAKNYGVAQNRDRAWMISVQGDYDYEFPKPIPLDKRLKDYLESNVDEKYYINNTALKGLGDVLARLSIKEQTGCVVKNQAQEITRTTEIANTLMARDYKGFGNQEMTGVIVPEATKQGYAVAHVGDSINLEQPNSKTRRGRVGEGVANTLTTSCNQAVVEPIRLGGLFDDENSKHQAGAIWDKEACGPTIDTMQGGYRQPLITEPIIYDDYNSRIRADQDTIGTLTTNCGNDAARNGYKLIEPSINGFYKQALDTFEQNECEYGDTIDAFNMRVNKSGSSPTLTTRPEGKKTAILPITHDLRIRKLTPLECWRLMGIDDQDYNKAKASGVSNSQLYKQSGNGLVVDVFAALISTMICEIQKEEETEVTMTVKELIEILSWCDEDKLVKVAKGDKRRDIISTDEDDESVVLIAS